MALPKKNLLTGTCFMQKLKVRPEWEEALPVSIQELKQAVLDGNMGLEIRFPHFDRSLPLAALVSDVQQARVRDLVAILMTQICKLAARCKKRLADVPEHTQLASLMGQAMCLMVVRWDMQPLETYEAQGFHATTPDRPAPPSVMEAAAVGLLPSSRRVSFCWNHNTVATYHLPRTPWFVLSLVIRDH